MISKIGTPIGTAVVIGLILLSACSSGQDIDKTDQPSLPTPTSAPLVAIVNDKGILLSEFEADLHRYQAAVEQLGKQFEAEKAEQEVLDDLIAQTLFAQAAAAQGYSHTDADIQAKIDQYAEELGGPDALQVWMTENFYDQESFRLAVSREMSVIWMRNYLIEQVPQTADQVHARQILVDTENEAIGVQRQLEAGTPFKTIAYEYDPETGGELGWFPRGYLLQPDVENAAFALQAGQYSGIIPTSYGFHILEMTERDPAHPLSRDALLFLQRQSLESWLEAQRGQSAVEILVP